MKKIDLISLNLARAEKLRKFSKKLAGELMIVFGCLIEVVRGLFFPTKILLSGESTYRPVKFAIRMILQESSPNEDVSDLNSFNNFVRVGLARTDRTEVSRSFHRPGGCFR